MFRSLLFLIAALACGAVWCEEPDEAPKPADESILQAVPKVPTLATIIADGNPKTAPSKWVQDLMKKKETKARVEIVLLKQKLVAQQEAQDVEERERIRRKLAYDKAHGTLFDTAPGTEAKKRSITMKLDFQVAEIETYRRLIAAYKIRATLADSVVETLTKLDRDNDGKLSGDEYRDAAHIFFATQRLFSSVDNDGDGHISLAEIDAAKTLPADAAAAMAAGAGMREANSGGLIIKDFDTDKDGVLTINERKALSSAYLDISLKSTHEAEAYQHLMDEMLTARQASAAKFENLTIDLENSK